LKFFFSPYFFAPFIGSSGVIDNFVKVNL
jgi:hypothetical protein